VTPAPGEPLGATGYVAADGFLDPLLEELGPGTEVHGRLVLVPGPPRPAAWAQNVWHDPVRLPAPSIGAAAQALRAIQRNWALLPTGLHRRAQLIQDRLPHVSAKPLAFPGEAPTAPLGSWTLLDSDLVVAAARCASPFPHGEVRFVEDKASPPNRAYLKLWEAFTVLGRRPGPGERCLDLGASPGGWSWVLQSLGARVVAVDKAPLAPDIAALPGIECLQQSAFALDPAAHGRFDWLCCDVICYPSRLLAMVRRWLDAGQARNFVCTLKFQGATDHETARAFAAIPGSRLQHLSHNKHELTWMLVRD
jgi:23S rRNA (cytidine2498-2'-O)-methyltransferase